MIEGFKLKLTSKELKDHCSKRAEYHRKRSKEKADELPRVKEAMEVIKKGGIEVAATLETMSKGGYRLDTEDVIEKLEGDIKDHSNKALVFDFFAAHLFEEDYTLQETDLVRLEILKRT